MCVEIVPQTCTRVNILSYTDLGVAVAIHGNGSSGWRYKQTNKQTKKQTNKKYIYTNTQYIPVLKGSYVTAVKLHFLETVATTVPSAPCLQPNINVS